MTTLQVKASAALWARRVRRRSARLAELRASGAPQARISAAERGLTRAKGMLRRRTRQLARRARPATGANWNPAALKVPGRDAGAFVTGKPRIVWHTTEGSSAAGAIGAYKATGSWPHFTFDFKRRVLYQHIPLNRSARALEHPPGTVETNRARAIQVELVGFAAHSGDWTVADYEAIGELGRWVESASGVRREASARFALNPPRLSPAAWLAANGHLGHEHVPNNHHWDPGAMRIGLVIGGK